MACYLLSPLGNSASFCILAGLGWGSVMVLKFIA